jgi:hypothetical protein
MSIPEAFLVSNGKTYVLLKPPNGLSASFRLNR